ncbi:MAG TPA: hypothetical protein VHN80_32245 [Kineosporiaceae bacterium]|nr:hypothetical protein [Kineosporiaceae bacterium]
MTSPKTALTRHPAANRTAWRAARAITCITDPLPHMPSMQLIGLSQSQLEPVGLETRILALTCAFVGWRRCQSGKLGDHAR